MTEVEPADATATLRDAGDPGHDTEGVPIDAPATAVDEVEEDAGVAVSDVTVSDDAVPDAGLPDAAVADAALSAGALSAGAASDAALTDAATAEGTETDAAASARGLETDDDAAAPAAEWADEKRHATALTWVDAGAVAAGTSTGSFDDSRAEEASAGLLRGARLRPAITRARVLVPVVALVGLASSYVGATLLWPLDEVAPTVSAVEFSSAAADATTVTWPAQGSAAVGAEGLGMLASSPDPASIASITKVVSSLMVLDRMPLALGEQGPAFAFTYEDNLEYWSYRGSDQSALDVPVGGTLTEYQLLQGTLLGSANNYIDRLAAEIWGSDEEFRAAAEVWLRDHGLSDITITTPSGFDEGNIATPEALLRLGELAMANPVFAEIVGTTSVELPGAGVVTNTNGMLADPGVVGIKTGTLVGWNLLTAKEVTVDDMTITLYAAVLNQDDDEQRLATTRSLFAEAEAALTAPGAVVPAGTVVARVRTAWGEDVEIVTDADTDVILWNGGVATSKTDVDVEDASEKGAEVGSLTSTGPLNSSTTELSLAEDLEGPSLLWRLTHPLELFGLTAK